MWNDHRAETLADGIVHGLGIVFGTIAVAALTFVAAQTVGPFELASVLIYGGGLVTMFAISAAYNLWPVSPVKWILRRFDHSAIYLLIAGTYTPFVMQMKDTLVSAILLAGIWMTSVAGITLKLRFPGRFDRLSILFYLLIGWSGFVAYDGLSAALPERTMWLLVIGGVLYTAGVVLHLWEGLRFQTAIWHGFVLAAAACHYVAVLDSMVLSRS